MKDVVARSWALPAAFGRRYSRPLAASDLAVACAALTPGDSAAFSGADETVFGAPGYEWQSSAYHDVGRGLIHMMSKPANVSAGWGHRIYDIVADAWTTIAEDGLFDANGHIYDNLTLDPALGDLYLMIGGSNTLRRFIAATQTWVDVGVPINPGGGIGTHQNGVAWHPHLYGLNDGGVIVMGTTNVYFWRKLTNSAEMVSGLADMGVNTGVGQYFASIDAVIGGYSSNVIVTPNAGDTPIIDEVGAPPIQTGGNSPGTEDDNIYGTVHQHPYDATRLLLLERSVGIKTVYSSTDGDTWVEEDYDHPFPDGGYPICVLGGGMGSLMAISKEGSVSARMIWKPPH